MSSNIVNKTYQRLSILVSLNGLSFCCFDTLLNQAILVKNIFFENLNIHSKIEDLFESAFKENPELNQEYDEILIIHSNNLSTFVPTSLFDEDFLGSYLQYNTKVFETDFFTFDNLSNYEMKNVYIPYVNINNFFVDRFGSFDYKHSSSILVDSLLNYSKNIDEKKMFVCVSQNHFEIVVVQNQKLIFYNSFEYKTKEDFIYYILFTAEQLQLNPENFKLEFLGAIDENSELYQIAYKYIRTISFFEVSNFGNSLMKKEKLEHFILLHS